MIANKYFGFKTAILGQLMRMCLFSLCFLLSTGCSRCCQLDARESTAAQEDRAVNRRLLVADQ